LNTITVISLIVGIVTGAFGLYIAVDKFVIEKTSCRISGHVYTQTGGDALLGAEVGYSPDNKNFIALATTGQDGTFGGDCKGVSDVQSSNDDKFGLFVRASTLTTGGLPCLNRPVQYTKVRVDRTGKHEDLNLFGPLC
jgi:hypothetical protein